MIYKVLIFAAATLITVDARAFPDASGITLGQLFGKLKDIEKKRHDALVKVAEKPQFKADENVVRYLATWAEYGALLIEIRKALEDIPWLHDDERIEATYGQDPRKTQKIADDFKILRARAQVIESKLMRETEDVPDELLEDEDFEFVLDDLNAGSERLLPISLMTLIEVTSNWFKKRLEPEVVSVRRAVADNAVM